MTGLHVSECPSCGWAFEADPPSALPAFCPTCGFPVREALTDAYGERQPGPRAPAVAPAGRERPPQRADAETARSPAPKRESPPAPPADSRQASEGRSPAAVKRGGAAAGTAGHTASPSGLLRVPTRRHLGPEAEAPTPASLDIDEPFEARDELVSTLRSWPTDGPEEPEDPVTGGLPAGGEGTGVDLPAVPPGSPVDMGFFDHPTPTSETILPPPPAGTTPFDESLRTNPTGDAPFAEEETTLSQLNDPWSRRGPGGAPGAAPVVPDLSTGSWRHDSQAASEEADRPQPIGPNEANSPQTGPAGEMACPPPVPAGPSGEEPRRRITVTVPALPVEERETGNTGSARKATRDLPQLAPVGSVGTPTGGPRRSLRATGGSARASSSARSSSRRRRTRWGLLLLLLAGTVALAAGIFGPPALSRGGCKVVSER